DSSPSLGKPHRTRFSRTSPSRSSDAAFLSLPLSLRGSLRRGRLCPFLQPFRRDIFNVRPDPPRIAPCILHATPAVAVVHIHRLAQRSSAGLDRAPVRRVHVRNVEIQRARFHCRLTFSLAHHDHRVADLHLGMVHRSVGPHHPYNLRGVERLLQEVDQLCGLRDHQIRSHGVKSFRYRFYVSCHEISPSAPFCPKEHGIVL